MALHLHDTLRRETRPFTPVVDGVVTMYVCGPTVQSAPHVGHLRSVVAFDVLRRWLEHSGYDVRHVRNVTDIEDKVLVNAAELDVPWWSLATAVTRQFRATYDALNNLPPTGEPLATGHITEMVELIGRLIDAGHAYAVEGSDVFFDVRSFPSYGELSGQRPDAMQPGEDAMQPGEDDTGGKRDPLDFSLWKAAKPGEPSWPSPWGPGRPGWHIECSAMATRYLGPEFDIHGAGIDLVFPHHENERAQSCAAGDEFARYWLHHGLVNTGGTKMSKSLGNSLFAADLLQQWRPAVLRYALVAPHYRSTIDWGEEVLSEAEAAYSRIENFVQRADEVLAERGSGELPAGFVEAMDNDLATPAAIAEVHRAVRDGNAALAAGDSDAVRRAAGEVAAMLDVLGLAPATFATADDAGLRAVVDALVPAMVQARQSARERGDYAESDRVRDALAAAGITVEDTPAGPRWRLSGGG